MVLADGENVVKEWHYAKSRETRLIGATKAESSVTVTNKRIISTVESNRGLSQEEIYLKDVSSVYSRTKAPSKVGPIILILLGVALIILGIVVAANTGAGAALVLSAVGVALVVVAIFMLLRTGFELVITTDKLFGTSISAGASNLKRRKGAAIRVRVNREAALEIQDTLGAVILNEKERLSDSLKASVEKSM